MTISERIEDADLHALVDGELDPERRRKVEDHLLQHPEHAATVEGWRRQNAALRAAFEPIALESPPLSLREAATRPPAPAQGQRPIETGAIHWGRPGAAPRPPRRVEEMRVNRRRQAIISSLVTLLAGAAIAGAAAFVSIGRPPHLPAVGVVATQGYAARANLTYATFATDGRPVEIDAARRHDLQQWLQERVGFSRPPDLAGLGLKLLGGRVTPGVAAPAGFWLYERDDGARLGLYFERAETNAPAPGTPAEGSARDLTSIEWRANGFAFVLISALGPETMQATAEKAAASVSLEPAAREPKR